MLPKLELWNIMINEMKKKDHASFTFTEPIETWLLKYIKTTVVAPKYCPKPKSSNNIIGLYL